VRRGSRDEVALECALSPGTSLDLPAAGNGGADRQVPATMVVAERPARLDIDCVSVRYGGDAVLQEVSLRVAHGAQVAVVGPNGAGKSTLFKALVGLLPLRSGRILVHGRPAGVRTDPVAYVPQREEVDWHFPVTVADVVMMGRYGRIGWLRRPGPADRQAVAAALDLMDLTDLARRPIGDLSGGQQQRVFLARALAQEPHVLLLDEPFTGVDVAGRQKTLDVLTALRDRDVTVLVSTHDLELAATRFEHVVLLNRRVIAQGPPAQVLTAEHISEAFGGRAHVFQGMVVIDECCPPASLNEEG
jgi:anchored repeat-type ABC transporter ATP-binding subunit